MPIAGDMANGALAIPRILSSAISLTYNGTMRQAAPAQIPLKDHTAFKTW